MTPGDADLGLIRPKHAAGGWRLEDSGRGWTLAKCFPGGKRAVIRPTTSVTCSWTVFDSIGRALREASSRNIEAAKASVCQWIQNSNA